MKALVICPCAAERPEVAFLARTRALALAPFLGRPLLDLWIAELASRGATEIRVLASDRPEEIRRYVGRGEAWGVSVEVLPETRELAPDAARAKYQTDGASGWLPAPFDVIRMDALPCGRTLWSSPAHWFAALCELMPTAAHHRVGFREFAPGVWIHCRARIAPSARLDAPCWIGAHAAVGARAHIGPRTIIEDSVFVDDGAEISHSFVGQATYVGAMTELRESLAWGQGLYKWSTGSFTEIKDDFLLGELSRHAALKRSSSVLGRTVALLALTALSPVALFALWRKEAEAPLFARHTAIRAPVSGTTFTETCVYHELNGVSGLWRRWPQLWNIVRGDFAWVGNRPLTPEQGKELYTDFERLWLAVAPGLFSLADAEGCPDPLSDEARAHASFYAVKHGLSSDWQIVSRILGLA
ncbi:MAG: sugar transferase [Verrucomicrobiales bacterium]|nr:sugar transferase [Verrucomicrobiales bacterium]